MVALSSRRATPMSVSLKSVLGRGAQRRYCRPSKRQVAVLGGLAGNFFMALTAALAAVVTAAVVSCTDTSYASLVNSSHIATR